MSDANFCNSFYILCLYDKYSTLQLLQLVKYKPPSQQFIKVQYPLWTWRKEIDKWIELQSFPNPKKVTVLYGAQRLSGWLVLNTGVNAIWPSPHLHEDSGLISQHHPNHHQLKKRGLAGDGHWRSASHDAPSLEVYLEVWESNRS